MLHTFVGITSVYLGASACIVSFGKPQEFHSFIGTVDSAFADVR